MSLPAISIARESTRVSATWVDVCALDDVPAGVGVAALVAGEAVALVKTRAGRLYAVSGYDPFSKAFVLARGIVGDRAGVPKLTSPMYKQSFDLRTGVCLDEPGVRVAVYPVRVRDGRVLIRRALGGRAR